MYEIIKVIIQSGNFIVSDITRKIDTLWAESKLTDEERQQLSEMMIDYINPNTQAPELKELYLQLKEEVAILKEEVAELKGAEETEPGPGLETTIPKWKLWDGISTDYQAGAVVEHNGKYYLTYSANGWGQSSYCVVQAVSDSPLGPFRKLTQAENAVIISSDGGASPKTAGPGHHCFMTVGSKNYIGYHKHRDYTYMGVRGYSVL